MPYEIKKVKGGYKVVDTKGKALEKKPISLEQARKQRIAVFLSEGKPKGFFK